MYSKFHVARVRIFRSVSVAFSSILLLTSPALAEDDGWLQSALTAVDWSVSGEQRTRFEVYDSGVAISSPFIFLQQDKQYLFSLRTNLLIEAGMGNFRIGAELMDSRAYAPTGRRRTNLFTQNAVEPIQMYLGLSLNNLFTDGDSVELKGGRYTLDLGSGRLFGRYKFRNTTDSFLGGHIKWSHDDSDLEVFYGMPFEIDGFGNGIEFDEPNSNEHYFGIHHTRRNSWLGATAEFYAYGANGRLLDFENIWLTTLGARLSRAPSEGAFDFDIEAAPQFAIGRNDIAYFAHAEGGYTFDSSWQPRVAFLFDIASGPGGVTKGKCTPTLMAAGCDFVLESTGGTYFNTLFGRESDDFGPTGIFNPAGRNSFFSDFGSGKLSRSNIVSPGIRLSASPSDNSSTSITYRAIWREDPIFSGTPRQNFEFIIFTDTGPDPINFLDPQVGHQVDAHFDYNLFNGLVKIEAGGALFFFGKELQDKIRSCDSLANGLSCTENGITKYAYTSLTVNF